MTLLLALLAIVPATAQISVDAPDVVGVNEQFNITFTLGEKASNFDWSPSDDFQLVWGPQTGSSTSISIVNGKTTRTSRYTYTYVLLPRRTGRFSMPAAHATVSGGDLYSKAVTIEVVSDGAGAASSSRGNGGYDSGQQARREESREDSRSSDMFMRLILSRKSVVQGEPVIATLKLYTRGGVSGFEEAKFPKFNGFWSQELESPQNIEFRRESLSDRIYNTAVLRKWVIIPQQSGSITIEPAELVCLVQQRVSTGGSIFDSFFDDIRTMRKRVVSEPCTVKVNPLPAGAPASFTGAVGTYRISASMPSDSMKVHDATSLKVTVSGKGNISLVTAPKVNFPPDSEVYDTKTSEKMDALSGGTSGSKTFEYPFIPRSHGDFVLPPVEFSYYDVNTGKYVTLRTPELSYHVSKDENASFPTSSGVDIPSVTRRDVKNLSEDIRYIYTRIPALRPQASFFVGSPLFLSLFFAVMLLVAAVSVIVVRTRRFRADTVMVRTRGASKVARKRLASANIYLKKNLDTAFYEELHKALLGYASDKMNLPVAELSKEKIAAAFVEAGAPEELASRYCGLLDKCEFARYAPAGGADAMQETYDSAMDLISDIDSNMKTNTGRKKSASALVLLLMLLSSASTFAADGSAYCDSLWISAVNAYSAGDYASAAEKFHAIEDMGLTAVELYVNIGDAEFKSGNIASAILYYERALKLEPSNADAAYNLEIARQRVQDRIDAVPEFFLKTWAGNFSRLMSSDAWAVLFLVFITLFAVLLALFFLSRQSVWRRTGFFGALVALLLSLPCIGNALWQKNDAKRQDAAVVMSPVCTVKSAPAGGSDLFVLHEGSKVLVLETLGSWVNIRLSDGREGWMQSRDITVI